MQRSRSSGYGQEEREQRPSVTRRPKSLTCYLCGQQFGTASLAIHERSCKKKFLIQQAQLPEEYRKELPHPPAAKVPTPDSTAEDFEEYNREAFEILNAHVMHRCHKCGRTFSRFDKYQNHAERCTSTVNISSHGNGGAVAGEGGVIRKKWKSKHPLAKAIAASHEAEYVNGTTNGEGVKKATRATPDTHRRVDRNPADKRAPGRAASAHRKPAEGNSRTTSAASAGNSGTTQKQLHIHIGGISSEKRFVKVRHTDLHYC